MTRGNRFAAGLSRRAFMIGAGAAGGVAMSGGLRRAFAGEQSAAVVTSDSIRPKAAHGAMVGDVTADKALIWSRADRPSRMIVEYAFTESFAEPKQLIGPHALETSDFTARVNLTGLPPGQAVFYRVSFLDLGDLKSVSEPVVGRFRTAPGGRRDITFLWSGDTAGQGWGINLDWGGMKIYETMRQLEPDFFIHCGDTIYADGPIQAEVALEDGTVWKNVTTEEKSKVAETLAEFRGAHRYNLMDENVRRFHAEVPQIWQWDDHEVVNNWSGSKDLADDDRYAEKRVPLLVARATRAFLDYAPIRYSWIETERVYRRISYGPSLDVFVIDMRSYRGPNTDNRQAEMGPETAFLGADQLRWLMRDLVASRATWKVIAADMPIGLQVTDGPERFENLANGNGPALGRELEMMKLLSFIKHAGIRNVVWLTADTHYTAAHYYDPAKARFTDFEPFWEFMSGPLNAGSYGPNETDDTFGIDVKFQKAPPAGKANLPPTEGLQFFGEVRIDGRSEIMTVSLKDIGGKTLYSKVLYPAEA